MEFGGEMNNPAVGGDAHIAPAGKCSDYHMFSAKSYHVQRADVGIGPYGTER